MVTCKECIHYEVCNEDNPALTGHALVESTAETCDHFKDKSSFIEFPCELDDTVYVPGEYDVAELRVVGIEFNGYDNIYRAKCKMYERCSSPYDPCLAAEEICLSSYRKSDFGSRVFATYEEAEKALKEGIKRKEILVRTASALKRIKRKEE